MKKLGAKDTVHSRDWMSEFFNWHQCQEEKGM